MATQPHSMLEDYRVKFDGVKFLSRSPWHSFSFLASSSVALVSVLFDLFLLFRFWGQISTGTAVCLFLIANSVGKAWWRQYRELDELGEIYTSTYSGERKPEPHVEIMLGRATSAILSIPDASVLLLLAIVYSCLSRVHI